MPTISDPPLGQHKTVVSGIYIARGAETLGPYNSLEAAALVIGGYLRADDYAACDGDPAWVSLADFLPPTAQHRPSEPALLAPTIATHPHRWRRLATAFVIVLTTPLLVAGGVRWFAQHRAPNRARLTAPPAERLFTPDVLPPPLAVFPIDQVELPEVTGPLRGTLSFALPGGQRLPLAGVRVSAYPLAALEPALARENAEVQAARTRLDPQIDAAAAERATRATEAQAALKAWREAGHADPLLGSLRFANQGARTAAKTAEDDYRYLLDERATAAGGEIYFRGLPEPTATLDTDAQGNFSLALPTDLEPYAVAVRARITTNDGTVGSRYWLVQLSPAQRAGRESLQLDDGNTSSSSAAGSLIHTVD